MGWCVVMMEEPIICTPNICSFLSSTLPSSSSQWLCNRRNKWASPWYLTLLGELLWDENKVTSTGLTVAAGHKLLIKKKSGSFLGFKHASCWRFLQPVRRRKTNLAATLLIRKSSNKILRIKLHVISCSWSMISLYRFYEREHWFYRIEISWHWGTSWTGLVFNWQFSIFKTWKPLVEIYLGQHSHKQP